MNWYYGMLTIIAVSEKKREKAKKESVRHDKHCPKGKKEGEAWWFFHDAFLASVHLDRSFLFVSH